MGTFGPIADEKVVFSDQKARAAAGNFIKRPMLVGNNANELSLFASILGSNTFDSPMIKIANGAFGCPSGVAAKARTDAKVKAWRYLFAGDFPNQKLADGAGAFHGSEIGMAFGTTEFQQQFFAEMTGQKIGPFPDTPEQKKLIDVMMSAWSGFAKDPENGLERMGWPVYEASRPTIVQLGGPNSSAIDFISPANYDRSCGMLNAVLNSATSGGSSGGLSGLIGMLAPGKGMPKMPGMPGMPGMPSMPIPGPAPGGVAGEGALAKGPMGPMLRRRTPLPMPRRERKY